MDHLAQALQAKYSTDWQTELTNALVDLAQVAGGTPKQVAVVDLAVDLRGLWPQTLTLDGVAHVTASLWPAITATAALEAIPPVGKPVDWLIRKFIRAYTVALRDPAQLPQSVFVRWPVVRALANHFAALGAVVHALHLDEEAKPVQVTLYGPLADETKMLMDRFGVAYHEAAMTPPWQRAFGTKTHMDPLAIVTARPRMGQAEAGLANDVTSRARHLIKRHWTRTPAPAFTKQKPQLIQVSGRPDAYTVFDLEFSSGNKQEGQFATEIGALKVRNGQIVDTFDCFVQVPQGSHLNRRSQALTGIHAGLLARFGRPATTALNEFQNFIGKDPVLGFAVKGGDLLVMQRQFGLYATPGRLLDVSDLAKAGGPMPGLPDVGLAKYRRYLGLDILAHGAVYDAVTTYALYAYLQGTPLEPTALMADFNRVFAQTSLR
ncbi:3'-5' exonuclease [Lacticaseibacillus jixiensis]|uniref:3'-5' exonuclease n=1 Tax=Lacticaseibacillus jixiensis TaxID=3231926 RepID=UPI0036F2CEB4